MLFRLITAWLCNLFDVISTLYFYTYFDGEELNPISDWLLQWSPVFIAVKLTVMTIAVVFCWLKQDWKFCNIVSWILLIEYLLVATYYLFFFMII